VERQTALFGLPEHIVPHSLIAFGYPADKPKEREPFYDASCVHMEQRQGKLARAVRSLGAPELPPDCDPTPPRKTADPSPHSKGHVPRETVVTANAVVCDLKHGFTLLFD
jgi:hypothetical protein